MKAFAHNNLTYSKWQILDSSKLTEFSDDNVKLDKHKKFSKQVENTVGKGEIACYSVLKRFTQQTLKNKDLFGKGLEMTQMT